MKAFPPPPVNTRLWSDSDWARYIAMNGVETEPATIKSTFGTWYLTGEKDEQGHALYSLKK